MRSVGAREMSWKAIALPARTTAVSTPAAIHDAAFGSWPKRPTPRIAATPANASASATGPTTQIALSWIQGPVRWVKYRSATAEAMPTKSRPRSRLYAAQASPTSARMPTTTPPRSVAFVSPSDGTR